VEGVAVEAVRGNHQCRAGLVQADKVHFTALGEPPAGRSASHHSPSRAIDRRLAAAKALDSARSVFPVTAKNSAASLSKTSYCSSMIARRSNSFTRSLREPLERVRLR